MRTASSPTLARDVAEPVAAMHAGRRLRDRLSSSRPTAAAAAVTAFAVVYGAATSVLALRRPLWNDELYTYHFARLSGVADLWRALQTGVDQAPPLSYLLAGASMDTFGVGRLSLRLPEIVAFLVFCICLYAFVARRTSPLHGVIAMLLPSLTAAYYYASEARAYALVLGFGAGALLCWQLATAGARRRVALVGLFAALFLATSSHYYAVLLLVPLCLGELTRTYLARRLDAPVWLALSGALLPLLAFAQLVSASHGYAADFWGRPTWPDAVRFFSFLLDTRPVVGGVQLGQLGRPTQWWLALLTVAILTAAVVVLSPAADWLRRRPGARAAFLGSIAAASAAGLLLAALVPGIPLSVPEAALVALATLAVSAYVVSRLAAPTPLLAGPPPHEVVAAASFLLLPLAGVIVAKLVTNAYADRYALPATIGLAVLPLALHRLEGRRPLVGAGAVAALAVLFVVVFVPREQNAAALSTQAERTLRFVEANAGTRAPILVDNPHQFLELSYASRPRVARRLFYVADPARGSIQRGLPELGRIASLRVYERRDAAELPGFLLALAPREAVWSDRRYWSALRALRDAGRTVTAEAVLGDQVLYAVTAPAGEGTVEQPPSGGASPP